MRFDRLALSLLLASLTAACGIDSETNASELFGPGSGGGGNAAKGGSAGATSKGGAAGNGTAGASEGGAGGGVGKGGASGSTSKGGSAGTAGTGGSGAKGGAAGAPQSGGAAGEPAGGSDAGGSDAGGSDAGGSDAGGANAGGSTSGNGGSTSAGNGGSTSAGNGGSGTAGDGGSTSAGNGGSSTAGDGGSTSAGNGGSTTAGNGGSTTAGNGGSTTAGNGGSTTAGNGGAAGGTVGKCGNGAIDDGEECDGALGTATSVACDANCKLLCDVPGVAFRDQQSKTCFFLLKGDYSWEDARKACEQIPRSRLATFEGDGQRPRIHFNFKPAAGAVYWVGAHQESPPCCLGGEDEKWKWRSPGGPGIAKENWSEGEPNDKDDWEGGEEDCGEARADDAFKMNDSECDNKRAAICQRPVL